MFGPKAAKRCNEYMGRTDVAVVVLPAVLWNETSLSPVTGFGVDLGGGIPREMSTFTLGCTMCRVRVINVGHAARQW